MNDLILYRGFRMDEMSCIFVYLIMSYVVHCLLSIIYSMYLSLSQRRSLFRVKAFHLRPSIVDVGRGLKIEVELHLDLRTF